MRKNDVRIETRAAAELPATTNMLYNICARSVGWGNDSFNARGHNVWKEGHQQPWAEGSDISSTKRGMWQNATGHSSQLI